MKSNFLPQEYFQITTCVQVDEEYFATVDIFNSIMLQILRIQKVCAIKVIKSFFLVRYNA